MNQFCFRSLLAALVLTSLVAPKVKADVFTTCGVDLGMAGRTKTWAVFTLGQDDPKKPDKPDNSTKDELNGTVKVVGDFGAAGAGNVKLGSNSSIRGDLYYDQDGRLERDKKARITGTIFHDDATDALLDQAAIDAVNASTFAGSLPTSPAFASMREINLGDHKQLTITGDGCTVLSLKNFKLGGDSVLTLTGTAGTAFVINVQSQFRLTGNAQIVLAGGLTAADVLFNVKGTGEKVEINGKTTMNGILLAAKREVHLHDSSTVIGEVIGNKLRMDGSAKVIGAVSPSTNP